MTKAYQNFRSIHRSTIMENQQATEKKKFTIEIEGLTLEIRHSPKPFASVEIEHFEIVTLKPACKPHPLSETGYKSLFIHPEWRKQFDGNPRAFMTFALEQAAKEPRWKDIKAKSQQLSLF